MKTRTFALVMGIVFLIVGVAGFLPSLVSPSDTHPLAFEHGHGNLMGLFPVNYVHDAVHVLFGIWGVLAYRTFPAARVYAKAVAVIYAVLTVMGLIPGLNTTFGLVPLYGNDIWLHALIAVVSAWFGFASAPETETAGTARSV
jgi:hypothetical protein